MEYLFIYLLQVADVIDDICTFMWAAVLFCVGAWALFKIGAIQNDDDCLNNLAKQGKILAITCVVIIFALSLAPSKQTLLLMGGTYMGKQAVNTVVTSDKMQKVNEIIDLQLDKYIKELKTTK